MHGVADGWSLFVIEKDRDTDTGALGKRDIKH